MHSRSIQVCCRYCLINCCVRQGLSAGCGWEHAQLLGSVAQILLCSAVRQWCSVISREVLVAHDQQAANRVLVDAFKDNVSSTVPHSWGAAVQALAHQAMFHATVAGCDPWQAEPAVFAAMQAVQQTSVYSHYAA